MTINLVIYIAAKIVQNFMKSSLIFYTHSYTHHTICHIISSSILESLFLSAFKSYFSGFLLFLCQVESSSYFHGYVCSKLGPSHRYIYKDIT